jgi:hypothetical protein
MVYNFNEMPGKKPIAALLTITLVFSSLFFSFPVKKTQAQWVVIDPTHIAVTTAEATRKTAWDIANAAAMIAAQLAIERIVASTVEWANSGFEGNPAYVTNPRQYFTNIADGVAGDFIKGSDLNFLCSPFQANIRLSLVQQYYQPEPFQCTLTDVVGNIDSFLDDFSQGGWEAWFSMTQTQTNNPYGAYIQAKIELDKRIASAVGLEQTQLDWNQGFRNYADCISRDDGGECVEYGPTKTPGSIIKSQLDRVLPSGLEKLISVENVNQLAQAFASGLLQRFVFGPQGLFSKNSQYEYDPSPTDPLDPSDNQCVGPALAPRSGTVPNEVGIVQQVASEYPELLQNSCLDQGGSWEFMDIVVERLHSQDPGFGYNGKRGDTYNLSQDAVSYYAGGSASDGERDVHIIDIIGGHCGANPQPAWQDVTNETLACGVTGAYVYPRNGRGAVIISPPPDQPASPEDVLP